MVMIAKYPGRCAICAGQILPGQQIEWAPHEVPAHYLLADCHPTISHHASGDLGLGKNIDGHEFKPDASPTTNRCAVCGTHQGVAWIAGAGEALCYRHQDSY